MNLNQANLIGRVTRDPETKSLPSGSLVTNFGLATNHNYTDKEGKKVENVSFHNCVAYGKTAETIGKWVVKGQELYVRGRIDYREWDKKEGGKGYRTEIVVDEFQFGAKPKGAEGRGDDFRQDGGQSSRFKPSNHDSGDTQGGTEADEISVEDLDF